METNDALKQECISQIDNALTHSWVIRDRLRELLQGFRGVIQDDTGPLMDALEKKLAK